MAMLSHPHPNPCMFDFMSYHVSDFEARKKVMGVIDRPTLGIKPAGEHARPSLLNPDSCVGQ